MATTGLKAQDVTTTDGQTYLNSSIRRSGEQFFIKVMVPGGTGSMEMGIPLARIAKVSFPEPPELAKAKAAAAKGYAAEVLSLTSDSVAKQTELKDLPGSWWPELARLRLLALVSEGKNSESAELARQMGVVKSPLMESLSRSGTLFTSFSASDLQAVLVGAKALPRIGGGEGSALAQFVLGKALLLKKDYPGALRAFLTIKVFYPSVALLQPAAMMGSYEAYVGVKDQKRASQTLEDIVKDWPDSPQAPDASKKQKILQAPQT